MLTIICNNWTKPYKLQIQIFVLSLSGLADCYLKLGDLENATKEAQRMLRISECIKRPDQIKIANEILIDIKKATKSKFKSRK